MRCGCLLEFLTGTQLELKFLFFRSLIDYSTTMCLFTVILINNHGHAGNVQCSEILSKPIKVQKYNCFAICNNITDHQ